MTQREFLEAEGGFIANPPGFIAQAGSISKMGKVAGENWHAVVGSAIYKAEGVKNIRKAALEVTSQII